MDETLVTTNEPQVIESTQVNENTTDTNVVNNTQTQDVNDGSQVIESATPMDNNITYTNVQEDVTPTFDSDKTLAQNIVQQAVQTSYDTNLDANSGQAMSQFLDVDYDYDKSEAGTYWVAGAINDVNTQMEFLNTLVREEMYDEMDLQKYYYDTTMATARAYAASKERETAYGYYRAAQEKAIAEAQLTGWYMPAEGNYMLGQYTVAQNKLEDPETTDEEKAKAQRVSNTVEKWFSANQISTRGIKCLSMMQYEETVRHNEIMAELQHEANQIAGSSGGASAALAEIQLREFKFQVEELELQYGWNFTQEIGLNNDNYLGHDTANDPEYIKYQALGGANNLTDLLKNPDYFAAVLGARNTQWLKDSLGEDNYKKLYNNYIVDLDNKALSQAIENNGYIDEESLHKETYKVSATDKEYGQYKDKNVYTFHTKEDGKYKTKCYIKDNDGIFHQIDSSKVKLQDGKTLADKVEGFSNTGIFKNGTEIQVGQITSSGASEVSMTSISDKYTNNLHKDKIKEYEAKGYVWLSSKHGDSGLWDLDAGTVMYNPETDEYITISDVQDKVEVMKKSDIKEVKQPNWKEGSTFSINSFEYMKDNSMEIGEYKWKDKFKQEHTAKTYLFVDGNQEAHIYVADNIKAYDSYLTGGNGDPGYTGTIISLKEAEKINPEVAQYVDDIANYRSNIKTVKAADNPEKKTVESKNTNSTPKASGGGGGSSHASVKDTGQTNFEKREAIFEKYKIGPIDQKDYEDILDPEELEQKIKSRYDNILAMGGAK